MRPLIAALALVVTACTPAQIHTVNQARAAHGQRMLGEVEAVQLYCAHWPSQRLTYLNSIGLDPADLGPAPTCPNPPTAPKPAAPTPADDQAGAYSASITTVWPRHLWGVVTCIQWEESRNNPRAVGGAGERGLMQIHPYNFISGGWGVPGVSSMDGSGLTWDQMFDPLANHRAALWLYNTAGSFNGWSTAPRCR